MSRTEQIFSLIKQDDQRVDLLNITRNLALPQCYVSAGFVRNLVWDHLHGKQTSTPLNDIDVIYFDPAESNSAANLDYEKQLKALRPNVNWQVRNQAIMHVRNGDKPYTNVNHAMSHWPEKETAVAVKINGDGNLECLAPFGLESLFNLQVTHNPKREISVFDQRVASKNWLTLWPKLTVVRNSV
ncbi:nucleotidyltransferase family protein [Vibrio atypicus]|uniref:nucleotidyltransferase family protein n=1 Tax=Vibrio atypicus TaxID=558271 RepID=UPI00135C64CA|nr:nucleotidyltransferase family protein [Vibrio atypicus]